MKKGLLIGIIALFLVMLIPSVMASYGCYSEEVDFLAQCTCEDWSDNSCALVPPIGNTDYCYYDYGIANYTVNPCVTRTYNYSTQMVVIVQAYSRQAAYRRLGVTPTLWCHNVSYRAIMNYGDANTDLWNDTGWISVRQLYPYTFNFTANKTGTLALYFKYGNPTTEWDTALINFTVATDGDMDVQNVVYINDSGGACISYYGSQTDNLADNAIYASGNISDYWSRSIIWLLITLIVTGAAWAGLSQYNKKDKQINTTIVGLIGMFMLLIGSMSRMIDWIYIGVVFVGLAAYIGIKIGRMVTKE